MLTLDLLRCKLVGDSLEPLYIKPIPSSKYFQAARTLLRIFRAHIGKTRGELEAELDEFIGADTHYRVYRGLAKIIEDNSVIEPSCPPEVDDPEDLRMRFFTVLDKMRPIARTSDLIFGTSTEQAFEVAAAELGMDAATLDTALYADLRENHVLKDIDPSLNPVSLIERYNVALAQAMLYRAVRAEIRVWDNYKMLFRWIKLARLMHTIEELPDGGYRIVLDGPVSLFQNSERYGVNMARFLPALLLSRKWEVRAMVRTSWFGEKLFRLGPEHGLRPPKKPEPEFDSAAEEAFFDKFNRSKKEWTVEREGAVLSRNGTVFVPDFVFRHADGRRVHLEIVGFWTPDYLQRKLSKLDLFKDEKILVAVPEHLNCAKEAFDGPVITFKTRLLLKDVMGALEELSEVEG